MLKYINIPKDITYDLLISKKACLAPSKYNDFYPNPSVDFRILSSLITPTSSRKKISKSEIYLYTEIGDIDVNTGFVDSNKLLGYLLPSENPIAIQQHDILISTVRTYRKGIGMVEAEENNLCCTPALFVIRDVDSEISKEYLLAILRSDFFIEQILSLQNRGMYPRLDEGTSDKVLIPIPKDKSIIKYVSVLSRAILNKQNLICQRNKLMLKLVEDEINLNQKNIEFSFSFPEFSDILTNGRMDAGYFSENHKLTIFKTQNYKNGCFPLDEAGLKLIPGPSLEIKLLGTRIDSNIQKKGFYRLVTPKQFSDFGTISYYEYLGTPRKINPIQYGDILFGESGTGRSIVYLEDHNHTINNAHAHILRPIENDCSINKAITIRAILSYYKSIGVIDHLTVGGSGGHLSPSYFNRVFIPDFPNNKQKQISLLYHNPESIQDVSKITIDNFIQSDNQFNATAGITELDHSAKKIYEQIDVVINNIVTGAPVNISFTFLE